jgi:hypothetical protein
VSLQRWWKSAKARVDSAVHQGDAELDRLEAKRAAEVADQPWLAADGKAPTFDEARARIEAEAKPQDNHSAPAPSTPSAPVDPRLAAERAAAQLAIVQRDEEAKRRLEQMRAELRDDPPPPPA